MTESAASQDHRYAWGEIRNGDTVVASVTALTHMDSPRRRNLVHFQLSFRLPSSQARQHAKIIPLYHQKNTYLLLGTWFASAAEHRLELVSYPSLAAVIDDDNKIKSAPAMDMLYTQHTLHSRSSMSRHHTAPALPRTRIGSSDRMVSDIPPRSASALYTSTWGRGNSRARSWSRARWSRF